MDFLKLLEEYENYKRGFGIEPKSSGHSACVDFAIWLNNNASQQSVHLTATPEPVCTCKVTAESYKNCDAHGNRRR